MGVPITILFVFYCDNKSAIQIACNLVFHEQTKHIDIDFHTTRQELQCETINYPLFLLPCGLSTSSQSLRLFSGFVFLLANS